MLILQRGRSRITLGAPSGRIVREDVASGEEGAFTFLKVALR